MKITTFYFIPLLLLVLLGLVSSYSDHSQFKKKEVKELKSLLKFFKANNNKIKKKSLEINVFENLTLNSDDTFNARLLISGIILFFPYLKSTNILLNSGLLDSSMHGNWNNTFLNAVNGSNFLYKQILQAFDLLGLIITFKNISSYDLKRINVQPLFLFEINFYFFEFRTRLA